MKKQILFLLLVSILFTAGERCFIIIGTSGNGKSTSHNGIFNTTEIAQEGDSILSETTKVKVYNAGKDSIYYGFKLMDTPGSGDTQGITNKEIQQMVEFGILQHFGQNSSSSVSGFIIMESAIQVRSQFFNVFTEHIALYGPSVLKSTVVIINIRKHQSQEEIQKHFQLSENYLKDAFKKNGFTYTDDKIVVIDAKYPTKEQIQRLYDCLIKLEPYKLEDIEKKKNIITEIYNRMINDPANLKTYHESEIVNKTMSGTKQEVHPETYTEYYTTCSGPKFSLGGFSYGCRKEKVPITLNRPKVFTVGYQTEVPTAVLVNKTMLLNEESHYWNKAVLQYEKEIKDLYKLNNK